MQTTITKKKMNNGISTAKANRLYWMGRYAERVYLALHMLRKYHDQMIDEDYNAYNDFCSKMRIENKYSTPAQFIESYLYDELNSDSIINMLELVHDNAMLLREEIMSETLSYIQLSIFYMKNARDKSMGLVDLQTITDYMLAFWGSVDERISNYSIRKTIKYGKFVESMDLHIRFGYPFERVMSINGRLQESIDMDAELCDEIKFIALKNQLTPDKFNEEKTLYYLNGLFTA